MESVRDVEFCGLKQIAHISIVLCTAWVAAAHAADIKSAYPVRPIRLVVPSSPGGGTDITARLIASKLTESLGQQVVVDNRSGAANLIGAEVVARSTPDGYTLLAFAATLSADAGTHRNLGYDLVKDFTPVMQTTSLPYLAVVNSSVPAQSIKELVALAKAKPNSISYASSGIGGLSHLSGALLAMITQTEMLHVPYKGGAPALADVIAGQVTLLFSSPLQASAQLRSGRLRPLAVSTKARLKTMPNLPTMIEAGVPGYEVDVWNGIIGPKGMPAPIVDKIYRETTRALDQVKAQLAVDGSEVIASPPETFAVFLKNDIAKWRKTADYIGLRLE